MQQLIRVLGIAVALCIGAASVAATAAFGALLSSGPESYIFAVILGGADCGKMLLPSLSRMVDCRRLSLLAMGAYFIFASGSGLSHIGLFVTLKDKASGASGAAKTEYQTAKDEKERLQGELQKLGNIRPLGTINADIAEKEADQLFKRSHECKDVTRPDSQAFCSERAKLIGERDNAEKAEKIQGKIDAQTVLLQGMDMKPVLTKSDAQAANFAELTGLSEKTIQLVIGAIIMLCVELGSSFLLTLALAQKDAAKTPKPSAEGATVESFDTWEKAELTKSKRGSTPCTEARKSYERITRAAGGTPLTPNAFGRQMTDRGYTRKKIGGCFHYVGVTLTQSAQPSRAPFKIVRPVAVNA